MSEKQTVDVPTKVEPLTAGDPVEAPALSQMGATFAERAAAAQGKQVDSETTEVEDKAVTPKKATTKRKKS